MVERIRSMIAQVWRRTLLGIDLEQRRWAQERVREIDRRLTALLTAKNANDAQRVVQNTGGKRHGVR